MAEIGLLKKMAEIVSRKEGETQPFDSVATVKRVEGTTAWVHFPGGVDETPVAMTINAVPGDTVRVRVSGGSAWIMGSDSAPPTDDRMAVAAAETAQEAKTEAQDAKIAVVNLDESLNQAEVFDRLTNGGANQGIYLVDGEIYINATMIRTGVLDVDDLTITGTLHDPNNVSTWDLATGAFSTKNGLFEGTIRSSRIEFGDEDDEFASFITNGKWQFYSVVEGGRPIYHSSISVNEYGNLELLGSGQAYIYHDGDFYLQNSKHLYGSLRGGTATSLISINSNNEISIGSGEHENTNFYVGASNWYRFYINNIEKVALGNSFAFADGNMNLRTNSLTIGTTPQDTTNGYGLRVTDSEGGVFGLLSPYYKNDGKSGIRVGASNISGHYVYLTVDSRGNKYVEFSSGSAAAWRTGLGVPTNTEEMGAPTIASGVGASVKANTSCKTGKQVSINIVLTAATLAAGTADILTLPTGFRPSAEAFAVLLVNGVYRNGAITTGGLLRVYNGAAISSKEIKVLSTFITA